MSDCCKRPKNPCMVCKRTVTHKTGLQCQGSCKSWIHFTCCSYTPGKIKDIKAKIIKVRCPCPDCSTQGPKEVIVKDSSFTCINKICPVNNPPKCTKHACPMNKICQQTSTTSEATPKCPPEWPGVPCGASCKKNTRDDEMGDRCSPPPCMPPPPCGPPPPCPPPCGPPPICGMTPPCGPPPCQSPPCQSPPRSPPPPSGTPQLYQKQNSRQPTPFLTPSPPSPGPPSPCPPCPTPPRCSPPSTPVMPSISIVENMCETVGLLSDQLNQLMCKMTDVLAPKSHGNPCRCPQNPRR